MSFSLYKARLKCLLRNKEGMFWCYMFPLILASCFFFAFKNIGTVDTFKTIPIAYVTDQADSDPLKEAILDAKFDEKKQMFEVTFTQKEDARQLLNDNKISAYILMQEEPTLYLKESGMNQTIVKTFLDRYLQISSTVESIIITNPEAINQGLMTDMMQFDTYVDEFAQNKKPDIILIYFYSLLAFTCIFSSSWGLDEVVNIQADLSQIGARMNATPINKIKLFLHNMLAAFTSQVGSILILFSYMYFIIKVDFGENILLVLLTCLIGSLAGLTFGAMIGIWVKQKAEVKESVLTGFIMVGAFLSGMMFANMKYIIANNFPILSYINPVNLITDAFYSLYYYDTYDRFIINILLLIGMSVIFGLLSFIKLRRRTYASI